jgi:Helix-hairpin-helix domain
MALFLALAIAAIRSYPKAITSFEEVATIRGVGAKMAEKIRELLAYGKITKVGHFIAHTFLHRMNFFILFQTFFLNIFNNCLFL